MSGLAPACSLAELDAAGGIVAVEHLGREAIVVRSSRGDVFALDRYCPHEGYPLDDADVSGETITCPWHGWCFDLRSGTCLTAGEDARAYAVEVREGDVYLDLDVAASEAERARLGEVLLSAVEAGDGARAARNVVRLVDAGAAPATIVATLARYGATHGAALSPATAVTADVLALAERDAASLPLLLAEAAAIVAEHEGRRPPRLPCAPASSFAYGGKGGAPAALAEAGAARDADRAEAIVLGLLERGAPAGAVARLLAAVASARFLGPWPLALVERASRLAGLDDETGRMVLGAAGRAVTLAPPLDGARPYLGRPLTPRPASGLAASLGCSLLAFDLRREQDDAGDASLLAVAEALIATHAAGWSDDPAALGHAAWLADDAERWRGEDAPAAPPVEAAEIVRTAALAAASGGGEIVCLAATRAALDLGGAEALAGVQRLLTTPRRERFTSRAVAAERRRLHG